MPQKKLMALLSHLFAFNLVHKETFQLRKKVFFPGHLDRSSRFDQTVGDFEEIEHVRTEEDAFPKK